MNITSLINKHQLPMPSMDYAYNARKGWIIPLAWVQEKVAVEIGECNNPLPYYNALAIDGWVTLRYAKDTIESSPDIAFYEISRAIERAQLTIRAQSDMLNTVNALRREIRDMQGEL